MAMSSAKNFQTVVGSMLHRFHIRTSLTVGPHVDDNCASGFNRREIERESQ